MSDDPFAAFKEGQPPAQSEADNPTVRKPRKKKIPPKKTASNGKTKAEKALPNTIAQLVGATPKKERKARKPRQAKEMRLPISMLLEIGSLSEEESGALLSIGAGLQKLPKKSRGKITQALSKIFG